MPIPAILPLLAPLLAGGGASATSGLNPITAGLGAVPEAFKLFQGIRQAAQAGKIRKTTQRPTMDIPSGMKEAVALSRARAYDPLLPGQDQIMNQMGANLASGARNIREQGGGSAERLAALASLYRNQASEQAGLGVQAAQNRLANERVLQNQLGNLANWQQQAWEYNKAQPYAEAMQMASQLGSDSRANVYSSLKGIGGAVASTLGTGGANQNTAQNGMGGIGGLGGSVGGTNTPGTSLRSGIGGGLGNNSMGQGILIPGAEESQSMTPSLSDSASFLNPPASMPRSNGNGMGDRSGLLSNALNQIRMRRQKLPSLPKSPLLSGNSEEILNQMAIPYNTP